MIAGASAVIEVPALRRDEITRVMNWIRVKATEKKLPFCWRQARDRGVGRWPGIAASCPSGYTNNGLTCGRSADSISAPSRLASCPSGWTNIGLTCFENIESYDKKCTIPLIRKVDCSPGYTDMGCFCAKGGNMNASIFTCPRGYSVSSITKRCIQDCAAGYTNTGETCFRGVSPLGMNSMTCPAGHTRTAGFCLPTPTCGANEELQVGRCYPKCGAGMNGVGPLCWQTCPSGWANCALGCAQSQNECTMVTVDQVMSTVIFAANVAMLGIGGELTAAQQAARATATAATKAGTSRR